ncbi:MAG: DNA polymerase III subunit delta [Eubacteriales bacterium]|nr:DNA polymerase III subunit delta [Eubacteriales bacterium]
MTRGSSKKTAQLDYRAWRKQIEAGETASLYLISGEETYLIDHGLKLLSQQLINPATATLDQVTLRENIDYNRLLDEIETVPFMSERRLILVYNSDLFNNQKGATADKQAFLSALAGCEQANFCLCLIESKLDRRQKKSFQLWQAAGGFEVQVDKETSNSLMAWLNQYFSGKGLKLQQNAAQSLILRCDSYMGQILAEADKLANFCAYAGQDHIDMELLDLCCREDLQGNIFQLTDAVSAKNIGLALTILDKLLKQNEPCILILFMLSRHFRQLLAAKDAHNASDLASGLRVPPFVAKRLLNQARNFSYRDLIDLCRSSYQADKAIKTGAIEERLALELLVWEAGTGGVHKA